jgi:site-specific DNA recombinase
MKCQLDTCLSEEQATTRQLHRNLTRQLAELDQQEERLLDLALTDTLPQDKIKQRFGHVG